MKNFTFFAKQATLAITFTIAMSLNYSLAQTVVQVANGTDISQKINGDTLDNGDRVDPHTIYELAGNGIYPVTETINIPVTLHIRGKVGDGEALPKIVPIPDDAGSYPGAINTQGDIVMENVYVTNKNGEGNPKWGGFRANGEGTTVRLTNVQIEWDKAAAVMLRKDNISVFMENCTASKTGNWKEFNGNGRLIDTRGTIVDSIVVKHSTAYLMSDRLVRTMGGEINYLEFDHVTGFQLQGRHGCFQLGKVHTAKITNCLLINSIYGGNHPLTEELTHPANDKFYVITMDAKLDDTNLEIRNNNIAYTSDVTEFWATVDTVSKPGFIAPLVEETLGNNADKAYFEEVVTLDHVPPVPMDFLESIYNNPTAEQHPDNFADEIGIANIDASYNNDAESFSADDDGLPIGSHQWWTAAELTSIRKLNEKYTNQIACNVYPNPFNRSTTLSYVLKQPATVEISLYDMTGKQMKAITCNAASGKNTYTLQAENMDAGFYMLKIETDNLVTIKKVLLTK